MKNEIRRSREEGRRGHNLLIGISPTANFYFHDADKGFSHQILVPSIGPYIGYRTQFREKLGVKAGTQFAFGPTIVSRIRDSVESDGQTIHLGTIIASGSKGMTYTLVSSAQILYGPIGRFTIEPGLGVTWGGHSASEVEMDGNAGTFRYRPQKSFIYPNGLLGGTLYLGASDQYGLSVLVVMGLNSSG